MAVGYGVHTAKSSHTYKVADDRNQQLAGGGIGLERTSAVSRPFMLIEMYERYVDDSNQIVIVPSPGAMYDPDRKKVIIDDNQVNNKNVMTDD